MDFELCFIISVLFCNEFFDWSRHSFCSIDGRMCHGLICVLCKCFQSDFQAVSQSIASHSPQFGMLPERGELALPYKPLSKYPSDTCKPNPSSPRSYTSFKKKSMAIKVAKPQGISKSRRGETTRLKRSKKRSGHWVYYKCNCYLRRFPSKLGNTFSLIV